MSSSPDASSERKLWNVVLSSFSIIVIGIPSAALAWAAARGLDLSDEGFYLLSVQDPAEYLESASQFPIPLAVVWSFGQHPVLARLVRLLLFVGIGAVLGGSTTRVAERLSGQRWSPTERTALVVAIVGAVLAPYIWLPQSPGYNDLVSLSLMSITSAVMIQALDDDGVGRSLSGPIVGVSAWVITLSKWPTALILLLGCAVWFASPRRRRDGRRAVVTFLVAMVATHLFVSPLDEILDSLRTGTANAGPSYELSELLGRYRRDLTGVVTSVVSTSTIEVVLVTGAGIASGALPPAGSARRRIVESVVFGGLGAAIVARRVLADGFRGGQVAAISESFAEVVLLVVWFWVLHAAASVALRQARPCVTWLHSLGPICLALPFVGAVGTNNSILKVAVNLAVLSVIGCILLFAGWSQALDRSRTFVLCALVATGTTISLLAVDTTWNHPYRQPPLVDATARLDAGPFEGLRLDRDTASAIEQIDAHRERLGATHAVSIGPISGLVVATGMAQPSFAWLRPEQTERVSRSLGEMCANEATGIILVFEPDAQTLGLAERCPGRQLTRQDDLTLPRGPVGVWTFEGSGEER